MNKNIDKELWESYSEALSNLNKEIQESLNSISTTKANITLEELASKMNMFVGKINLEVSRKVGINEIISYINMSPESIKIKSNKIYLVGYVTVGDLESDETTTINNAHVTSGIIEGKTMIALNGSGKGDGVLTVNNADAYLEYFRCREAWMLSPYANGWKVPLIHSRYGTKDSEIMNTMIDELSIHESTQNWLRIDNTMTGRVEWISLEQSYLKKMDTPYYTRSAQLSANEKLEKVKFLNSDTKRNSAENNYNILDIDSLDDTWIEDIPNTLEKKLNFESIITDLIKIVQKQNEQIKILKQGG
ncbi:hypothetical protein ACSXC4_03550 [Clostridium perfringens]|uniref:Peptidase S74 domain-containing protein n=1 Tax=Clostridium perfringens TaxID=1502 RepID=A0A127EHR0_CLOPF|nr:MULTISPECIES: hypothetical protein [Clostridium]AMN35467.1 hypothetical protein JFP838_06780 [Clostridium perfringens]MDK7589851.1 hypothetical protein [Clostridium sp. UMB9555B]MDK7627755.1 hypothetical protein [Clostridium sp. UMB9555A]MDM0609621.1 hypothetical protein [Clostridium perfringens]